MIVTLLLVLFVSGGALSSLGVASKSSSTSVYYVNSKQHSCTGECHTLSHYTNKTDWSPNTTLIFLPGEHELHAHLIIEKLETVMLKGQGIDPPVIKCTKESLMIKIKDCNAVSIEGITIKCRLLFLVDNNATIVTNISASQSYFHNSKPSNVSFSTVTISHSKFMCDEKPTHNCIGIYHNTGRIILQDVITSNKHRSWNGIDIRSNGKINIKFCNVSAIGNNNNGIRLALNKCGKVDLTGVNVPNNIKDGIYFWCSGSTHIYQTNATSSYCSYKDAATIVFYCK